MAQGTFGSPQSVTLNGITFDVPADCDMSFVRSKYKTEVMASTGQNYFKNTRQVESINSVVVFADQDQVGQLQVLGEAFLDFTMNVKLVDGSIYSTKGQIDFEAWSNQEGKAKISLHPRKKWEVTVTP